MERDAELVRVSEFMNRGVKSLAVDTPIEDALIELRTWGVSGAPVLEDHRVVGVLSERDCMRVLSQAAYYATPEGAVGDHMTREVDVLTPEQDVFAASSLFTSTNHRRFPVVDDGALVGIVTVRDIDRALWEITQKRHKPYIERHPGAAWDPEASRRRDKRGE